MWERAVVLALCVAAACGGAPATPASPGTAAGTWRAETSEHFVVWTNASPERARLLVRTMENLRQVVLGVSFFHREARGKSFVIAFNDLDEVHQYVPPQFIAHTWSGHSFLLQPVIVLAVSSLDHDRRIVTHELTHAISFNVIPGQPDWFAEGLAGYFETVRLDENHASVDVGVPRENRFSYLHDEGLTPVADLFACTVPACKDERFYATTWALLTYLLNERSAELMQYMTKLIVTPPEQQSSLWTAMFPSLTPSVLDHELAMWVRHGSIKVMKYKIALRDWPVRESPLTQADVLAAKAVLRYLFAPEAGAPSEVASALGLDATNVLANMIKAVAQKSFAPDLARSITSAHPDDWRAWWLAWRAATSAAEAREARDKTCSLLEADPSASTVEVCTRDPLGTSADDPRRQVFIAAAPRFSPCFSKTKPGELAHTMTIDFEVADSGAVTSAQVSMGSAETNACVEKIMLGLTFPPHHPGPLHFRTTR